LRDQPSKGRRGFSRLSVTVRAKRRGSTQLGVEAMSSERNMVAGSVRETCNNAKRCVFARKGIDTAAPIGKSFNAFF
jgi:hypothetical protein